MAKKTKQAVPAKPPRRYKVTQPEHQGAGTADYPEYTTRIASNSRFILAANHPDWYEVSAKHEAALLALFSRERLEREFPLALESTAAVTPFHAYGLVLLQLMGEYAGAHLSGNPHVADAFTSAVGTVISNLSKMIFRDPQTLTGSYTVEDLQRWRANFDLYVKQDLFVYRPGESGTDIDGTKKPIIELCPVPELGRQLVASGFEILSRHVANRSFLVPERLR